MKNWHFLLASALALPFLNGCISDYLHLKRAEVLTEIESLALCQQTETGLKIENKIKSEHGFRRFSTGTYRPVLPYYLFGHAVHIIELSEERNKVYVAGNPREIAYNFERLIDNVTCEKDKCQAPLPHNESLLIYKVKLKKAKDTTIVECSHSVQSEK